MEGFEWVTNVNDPSNSADQSLQLDEPELDEKLIYTMSKLAIGWELVDPEGCEGLGMKNWLGLYRPIEKK
jgi:hypothetical protein